MASASEADEIIKRMNQIMPMKYEKLKEKQIQTIIACKNNDVLSVLPTGYGKTVIIQALPFLTTKPSCIIITNGLNGIIQEQKDRFQHHCVVIDQEIIKYLEEREYSTSKNQQVEVCVQKLIEGNEEINYIISHPEHIVHPRVKTMLMSKNLADRITHFVVDEAHCILSWGYSDFRPAYKKLGSIRAVLKDCKILGLTATANKDSQKEICSSLQMNKPVIIMESPDRPNVYLEVVKRPSSTGGENTAENSIFEVIDPIIKRLKENGKEFPKTVIYVPLKWCGILHHRTVTTLENEAANFTDIVSQYHSPQSTQMKTWIINDMRDVQEGRLRLLYATEAYGMGIDVPDIRHVVHVGPPSNMETYVQEIGRCGRDGEQSIATLFYNNTDLSSVYLNDKMKNYVKNVSVCRRKILLDYFNVEISELENIHNCCDICRKMCNCHLCCIESEKVVTTSEIDYFNKKQKEAAHNLLSKYFKAENSIQGCVLPHLHTGLCENTAVTLASKPSYADPNKILEDFPTLKPGYIQNISKILYTVKHLKL